MLVLTPAHVREELGRVPERGIVNHGSDRSSFVGDPDHGLAGRFLRDIDASSGGVEIGAALVIEDQQPEVGSLSARRRLACSSSRDGASGVSRNSTQQSLEPVRPRA
jgi:hypothetical protein